MHIFYLIRILCLHLSFFFFFNDTATTEIYTLSLHDALPISGRSPDAGVQAPFLGCYHPTPPVVVSWQSVLRWPRSPFRPHHDRGGTLSARNPASCRD